MMLRKSPEFSMSATYFCVRQSFLGHSAACSVMLLDELPRSLKADALMRVRKQVRAIIGRAKRKHAIASTR